MKPKPVIEEIINLDHIEKKQLQNKTENNYIK